MADKKYKLKFHLSNGTVKEVEFVAPQGPQGDPFTYADFTQEQLAALKGPDGKSAYEYAQEAGFEGSEEEFAQKLAAGSGAEVGDILTTVRTDLGEKWLLCNGERVSANDYSKLADLLPVLPGDWTTKTDTFNTVNCVFYANGYWVIGGKYNYVARIAYATDPTGTWTIKVLDDSTINCITYANGYWVAGGSGKIFYTADPAGTWTTKDLWSGTINCITYANGKWVAGGRYEQDNYTCSARVAYTTDPAGTWTTENLWGGYLSAAEVNCIAYGNGYWMLGGEHDEEDDDATHYYSRIAYTTDLTGEWTTKDLWSGDTGSVDYYKITGIAYGNGYWVVCGHEYSSSLYAIIAYATTPGGTWTEKQMWYASSTPAVNCLSYANGLWVVGGQSRPNSAYTARIAYTTDPTGEWTDVYLWSDSSAATVYGIAFGDHTYMAVGQHGSNSKGWTGDLAYAAADAAVLPTISTDGAYNYIKALEG